MAGGEINLSSLYRRCNPLPYGSCQNDEFPELSAESRGEGSTKVQKWAVPISDIT